MRATFFGIEIGKSGIQYSQLGLDVTGHNIANVETAGYTRQRLVGTAYDPFATIGRALPVEQALVGHGVKVKILDQIRSAYLDRRFRTENTIGSYWDKRAEGLRYLESFFDNVNEETSINHSIDSFFKAMKVLAEDTVEGAPRTLLQSAGHDLTQLLNSIYAGLIDLQESQNQAVKITVDDINRIAEEIVQLNKAIYGFEVTGHIANDLRDKRNLLLDELSGYIDIEYWEEPDHTGMSRLTVKISGEELLKHDKYNELGVRLIDNEIDDEDQVWQVCWVDPDAGPLQIEVPPDSGIFMPNPAYDTGDYDFEIKGGELKAYLDMRDNMGVNLPGIPHYIEMLNDLARALVQEINIVHRAGYTDPPIPPAQTGVNFFYYDSTDPLGIEQITAKNIRLSDEVRDSAYNIACSTVEPIKLNASEYLQRGNNENMNKLYELFLEKGLSVTTSSGTTSIGSFDGFATSIRFNAGNTLNYAIKAADTSYTLTLAAENQRTSISGVSLDEEMTNLMKYQHAYSGASRVINAMDEALDRLINGTGRVGL